MSHEIKVNGYKPSKWPSRPEMNVDAHEKPAVQPDWEQNDDTEADYIKNRPFYEEEVDTLLDPTIENWRKNESAKCSWRVAGVDYIDVRPLDLEHGAGFQYKLGDVTVLVYHAAGFLSIEPSDADVHILKRESGVKQLDPKFLPPNRFVVNVRQKNTNGNLTADKTIAEIIEAYEAGKDVVASYLSSAVEFPLCAIILKEQEAALFDVSQPGRSSRGLFITSTEVHVTDELVIPKIYPVDAELIGQMNVPVGVDNDGRLFSENPTVNVGGSDMKLEVFNHLIVGKTVRCSTHELGDVMLLPYSYTYSGTDYKQYSGIAIVHTSRSESPIRFYRYVSENGMDGAKLMFNPINNEIIGTNISGNAVSFCGEPISDTTLTEAISIYHAQRPLLTYNHEPFIAAELTDNSITIVYTGKGEDGQYSVQKTTFGGITWESETT